MSEDSIEDVKTASRELADAMRRIIQRLVLVRPSVEAMKRATATANAYADDLDKLAERTRSWEVSEAGLLPRDFVNHSPLSGPGNPIAPPIHMSLMPDTQSHVIQGRVTFGPAYEGPPGHVHGGFIAAMFDELLGFAQLQPGFTAYLHVNYRRPTPLNRELALEAKIDRTDGRKRWITGTCHLDGQLLTNAEGLFIAPRTAEDFLEHLGIDPKSELKN